MSSTLPFCALMAAILLPATHALHAQNPVFENRAKERPATVSIQALTNYAHLGFAGNHDIYVADVTFKEGDHETAKLIDTYPNSANPIRRSVLAEHHLLRMRLTRTPECDSVARDLMIATRETNIFDQSTRATLAADPTAAIPCYKIAHDSTHLAKK